MSNLYITVKVPSGQIEIDKSGLYYVPEEAGDTAFVLPLEKAQEIFSAVVRSVEVLLEVEPGRASVLLAETCGTDGHFGDDRGEADPPRLPAHSSPAPSPYCPFCQKPTCACWEDHVCR